jgi:hypothetical protein
VLHNGIEIPYAPLRDFVRRAGVSASTESTAAERQLAPLRGEILGWIYRQIVTESRAHGVLPIFVLLPQVYTGNWQSETPETLRLATEAGFVVFDLSDVYAGHDISSVRLAEWDNHPNALGHRLAADRLYQELRRHADLFAVDGTAKASR